MSVSFPWDHVKSRTPVICAILLCSGMVAWTQAQEATDEEPYDGPVFEWIEGPVTAELGEHATIDVPTGYIFIGPDQAPDLMEALGNPPSGMEQGVLAPASEEESWLLVFEFADIGYVKDDEKDDLDAEALLKSFREGNESANEFRRERGLPTMRIVGWQMRPRYNERTHLLEWCLEGESAGHAVLNYNTRLLGRRGVMSATLLIDPVDLEATLPTYRDLLDDFQYTQGNRYAEYRKGDRISELGLTALVAGGAGALALKTGFFKKFFKLIIVGIMALGGMVARFFRRLTGREPADTQMPSS